MANLKEISRKIKSVKNTQKTTRAMKLVSSAKLIRTKQLSERARDYASKINSVLSEIAHRVSKVQDNENISRAFVANDNPKTVDIVFVTADKGLCGGFNMRTIKAVNEMIDNYKSKGVKVRLSVPETCFVAFICAAPPTLDTERPTLIAGLIPELNKSVSRKI